jgi:hypothetical protein
MKIATVQYTASAWDSLVLLTQGVRAWMLNGKRRTEEKGIKYEDDDGEEKRKRKITRR